MALSISGSNGNNPGKLWQHTHVADLPTDAAWDGNYCWAKEKA
jgi:hypothetical protein